MMFVVGCKELYKALKFIGGHKAEAVFHVEDDVLWTRVIDPANVAMLEAYIPITEVVKEEGEDNKFVVDVDKLLTVIEKKKKEVVDVEVKGGELKCKRGNITYTVRLLTYDEGLEPKALEMEWPAKIVISAKEFKVLLNAAKKVGDAIEFNKGKPMVRGDLETLMLNLGDEVECDEVAKYSVAYLETLSPVLEDTATVTIEYATNRPCRITVQDGAEKYVMVLAPRVDIE